MTDPELRAMLAAFAGPAAPMPRPVRRRATARTAAIAIALVAVGGGLVPAARALVRVFESPQQFVSDKTQPARAREVIENYLAQQHGRWPSLTGVEPELTADTPDGRAGVYGLRFSAGVVGAAIVGLGGGDHVGALWDGPPNPCPPGWAISVRGSFVAYPGHTPVYVQGQVSSSVTSVDVEEADGRVEHAAIGNGYLLAWISPGPRGSKPAATLIARNASGAQVGALFVGTGGAIPLPSAETLPGCG